MIRDVIVASMLSVAAVAGEGAWPPAFAVPTIVAVAADSASPRQEAELAAGCRHRDSQGLVTFVKAADGRVLLAALTSRPLADPRRDLWLSPGFLTKRSKPRASATQDWAYVYDQDGDGHIDWIAFLIGPLAIRTGAADEGALPRIVDGPAQVTGVDALGDFIARLHFGFWQAGDSDGDGAADLAAWPAERSADGWYQGWAVERLAERPGEVMACTLIDVHGRPETGCAANGRDLRAEGANAHRWATDPAAVLARIRAAGDTCRLTPADLRRATT
jgi:hypothetical protein